jgi:hypothetical protein
MPQTQPQPLFLTAMTNVVSAVMLLVNDGKAVIKKIDSDSPDDLVQTGRLRVELTRA